MTCPCRTCQIRGFPIFPHRFLPIHDPYSFENKVNYLRETRIRPNAIEESKEANAPIEQRRNSHSFERCDVSNEAIELHKRIYRR